MTLSLCVCVCARAPACLPLQWHAGFFTEEYTPTFRGFQSFYGFYTGGEDYFSHNAGGYDFRRDPSFRCGENCSQVAWEDKGKYSTTQFATEAVSIVNAHPAAGSSPLFLYLAFQAVHAPPEVPKLYVPLYGSKIHDAKRANFAGMLGAMDQGVGNLTAALAAKQMLDDIIIVFTADNGGPTTTGDAVGSRNFPLRGGKHSIWEGGARATACVWSPMLKELKAAASAKALAAAATGRLPKYTLYPNLMHASDWLPTLVLAAGGSTEGSLPLDGFNQWPAIVAAAAGHGSTVTPPRLEVFYGSPDEQRVCYGASQHTKSGGGLCLGQNALRKGDWKVIVGGGGMPNTWFLPVNASTTNPEVEGGAGLLEFEPPSETYLHGWGQLRPGPEQSMESLMESPFLPRWHRGNGGGASSCSNSSAWSAGFCLPGGTAVGESAVTGAAGCCAACAKSEACGAWIYRSDRAGGGQANCWLKNAPSALVPGKACTAGIGSGGSPPPPPPGPPPPPQLYNVTADPGEHTDVAAANPEVVKALLDRLDFYLGQRCGAASSCPCRGGVPTASNDPTCGPVVKQNDSHVGLVVGPWC
eukprot:SAG22_NODE_281_length_13064_cov_13.367605_8_plen_584_part_00